MLGTMAFDELYTAIEKDVKLSSRMTLRLDCFFLFLRNEAWRLSKLTTECYP